jgi:hypothetical protein
VAINELIAAVNSALNRVRVVAGVDGNRGQLDDDCHRQRGQADDGVTARHAWARSVLASGPARNTVYRATPYSASSRRHSSVSQSSWCSSMTTARDLRSSSG